MNFEYLARTIGGEYHPQSTVVATSRKAARLIAAKVIFQGGRRLRIRTTVRRRIQTQTQ